MSVRQSQHTNRQCALVIGASIAGLLAARVLSDYFEQVIVIERDQLPGAVQARKGVPQGLHTHIVLDKGVEIISTLFPDLSSTLEADGAVQLDATRDFCWFHYGKWKLRFPGQLRTYGLSRLLLEHHVLRRVSAIPNIRVSDSCEVRDLVGETDDRTTITGVRLHHRQGTKSDELVKTNLVVDASGRGSQTPHRLKELGYPLVKETLVKINVGYATRVYRRSRAFPQGKVMGIFPMPGEKRRYGYLVPIEGDAWFVTLSGYLQDQPPVDEGGFLEFARSLSRPDLYEAIKDAQPLGPIAIYKFSANRRRHYERLRMPEGLIVLGDAACSFNPIYGQGMTVAALGAQILHNCLQQQVDKETLVGLPLRFQKALARVTDIPWQLTTSEDFRQPGVEGKRFFGLGMLQHYTERVFLLADTDPFATLTFYEVMHMQKPPTALFHPRILLRALLTQKPTRTASPPGTYVNNRESGLFDA